MYPKQKFQRISEAKIKEGIFKGPQIRQVMKDGEFDNMLNEVELRAWRLLKQLCYK